MIDLDCIVHMVHITCVIHSNLCTTFRLFFLNDQSEFKLLSDSLTRLLEFFKTFCNYLEVLYRSNRLSLTH